VKWRSWCQEILDVVKPFGGRWIKKNFNQQDFLLGLEGGKVVIRSDVVAIVHHVLGFVDLLF